MSWWRFAIAWRGLRGALDRARVDDADGRAGEPLGHGVGLRPAFVGEIDAGHPPRQHSAGVRGDGVTHENEARVGGLCSRSDIVSMEARARCSQETGPVIGSFVSRDQCQLHSWRSARDRAPPSRSGLGHGARAPRLPRRSSAGVTRSPTCARAGRAFLDAWARLGRSRPRRRRGVRVLPRRLSPRPRPAPPVGVARSAAMCGGSTRRIAGSCVRSTGSRHTAAAIGENDEAERCAEFLAQLDPDWDAPPIELMRA